MDLSFNLWRRKTEIIFRIISWIYVVRIHVENSFIRIWAITLWAMCILTRAQNIQIPLSSQPTTIGTGVQMGISVTKFRITPFLYLIVLYTKLIPAKRKHCFHWYLLEAINYNAKSFSTSSLLTFGLGSFFVVGAVLCTIGC